MLNMLTCLTCFIVCSTLNSYKRQYLTSPFTDSHERDKIGAGATLCPDLNTTIFLAYTKAWDEMWRSRRIWVTVLKWRLCTKFRRYADLTTRQTKTHQFDFLKTIHEKKCMKCPRTFSLLRAKVLNLVNKQSTILCVSRQSILCSCGRF